MWQLSHINVAGSKHHLAKESKQLDILLEGITKEKRTI